MARDSLRSGFVKLCFDPSNNILGTAARVVIEGQFLTAANATADVLTKVTSVNDLDTDFGEGAVITEALKRAISCCGNSGVEFFALPRADAAGAVAAEYTLTVTGSATSAGRVDIYMGDSEYNISVFVAEGATADAIAADIQAAISADFPYTATVVANVVTLVAKNAGTVGNFLNVNVNWHGRNNYMPEGVTVTDAQTVVGVTNPAALDYSAVLGECCVASWVLLTDDVDWQDGVIAHLDDAWDCDSPQCFGHAYTYNTGTLGQILATDTNSATVSRLTHCATDPVFPYLKTAVYGAKSACATVDNPEISIEGQNFGILDCVKHPESCVQCFTYDEQVQLREAGFVVTVPVSGGTGSLTSPMITNDITNNRFDAEGRQNLTFRDVSARRLATETAIEIATELQTFQGLGYFSAGTNIREGVQGTNKNIMLGHMRAWAKSKVGVLFSEFDDLTKDLTFTDDFETAPACQGVPGKVYMNLVYRQPTKVREVGVNAAPTVLTNC